MYFVRNSIPIVEWMNLFCACACDDFGTVNADKHKLKHLQSIRYIKSYNNEVNFENMQI